MQGARRPRNSGSISGCFSPLLSPVAIAVGRSTRRGLSHGTSVAVSHEDDLQREALSAISPEMSDVFYWAHQPLSRSGHVATRSGCL